MNFDEAFIEIDKALSVESVLAKYPAILKEWEEIRDLGHEITESFANAVISDEPAIVVANASIVSRRFMEYALRLMAIRPVIKRLMEIDTSPVFLRIVPGAAPMEEKS